MHNEKTQSLNGLNNLPVDSEIVTWGYGATPEVAVILSRQRVSDGTYLVGLKRDTLAVARIHPDDIEKVLVAIH